MLDLSVAEEADGCLLALLELVVLGQAERIPEAERRVALLSEDLQVADGLRRSSRASFRARMSCQAVAGVLNVLTSITGAPMRAGATAGPVGANDSGEMAESDSILAKGSDN